MSATVLQSIIDKPVYKIYIDLDDIIAIRRPETSHTAIK